jgi:hypothetical protein
MVGERLRRQVGRSREGPRRGPQGGADYNAAEAKRVAVAGKPTSTKPEIEQASKDRDAAFVKFTAAHAKYTALPEEADAWKIGLAVKAAVQK